MQQYHRKRHRIIWLILTPVIIVVFILAIANRPNWPEMESLPGNQNTQEPGK